MARRTKEDALATRHRILDAAEQVFESQGVARTSLQQIAAAAGVTRGAIYWHFKDKAELFSAMMDRVLLPCEWAMDDAELIEEEQTDPLSAVTALALAPLEQLSTDERLRRVFTIAMHFTEYADEMSPVLTRCDEAAAFGGIAGTVAQSGIGVAYTCHDESVGQAARTGDNHALAASVLQGRWAERASVARAGRSA